MWSSGADASAGWISSPLSKYNFSPTDGFRTWDDGNKEVKLAIIFSRKRCWRRCCRGWNSLRFIFLWVTCAFHLKVTERLCWRCTAHVSPLPPLLRPAGALQQPPRVILIFMAFTQVIWSQRRGSYAESAEWCRFFFWTRKCLGPGGALGTVPFSVDSSRDAVVRLRMFIEACHHNSVLVFHWQSSQRLKTIVNT